MNKLKVLFGGAPIQIDWIVMNKRINKNIFLEKIISSGDFLKESTIIYI